MAGAYDFCLAGGYAVQAHGFLDAYAADGLDVAVTTATSSFGRLRVTDPTTGATSKVELGVDWRAHPPVALAIGPVLHPDDAVANKVCALYSRAQARDFIDVDAVLRSGRYSSDELLALAREHDPGFDQHMFVVALRAVRRLPEAEFVAYGMQDTEVRALLERTVRWADELRDRS